MRPPVPPFNRETALEKVRMAENSWNSRNPEKVSLAYTEDSEWRNRDMFVTGRAEIVEFLTQKWRMEKEYRLIKQLFAFHENRIAVRYAYEFCNETGQWFRAYGNENWEFDDNGLMSRRYASINDLKISEKDRLFHWPQGTRLADHPALGDLNL
ncbi:DUF1348 family protein [Sneathiella sp. HT1-7]|jgi:nuclear transport factor 2 (NTF2) superfamily protein|uniref:nuclear transport factor 2 family protein n=1 Tax=Sneathiella sp. HT1-7 TaxID=2887192 RepID=UPI001D13D1FF|nr:nuclear transport factor 2 family protein [Sneathiella sp. HT1-7]MCC3304282.1 nuclear transport factor 2 family protein [Sneathiella sp. HT1-7]